MMWSYWLHQTVTSNSHWIECTLRVGDEILPQVEESMFVPTLTYGHELWVVTERTRSWVQVAEMSYLRRVAGLEIG